MSASRWFVSVMGIAAGFFAVISLAFEVTNLTAILGMVCSFCLGLLWGTSDEE